MNFPSRDRGVELSVDTLIPARLGIMIPLTEKAICHRGESLLFISRRRISRRWKKVVSANAEKK